MIPGSAVGAVSHKYSLSSEFGQTKISGLQLQGCNAASCASSLSLESSEVHRSLLRSLQNIRITWDWASSHTEVVWIPAGLPWNWSKLSFWVMQLLLGALSVFQGWSRCHDWAGNFWVWLPRLKLHSLQFFTKLFIDVFILFFPCRKFEMTVFFLFCSPSPRNRTVFLFRIPYKIEI